MEQKVRALSEGKTKLLELLLREKSSQALRPCPRGISPGRVQLVTSYAQQRLWFVHELGGGGAAYNNPMAILLEGTLDANAFHRALGAVVQRHEVLRTVFVNVAGEPKQEIASEGSFHLQAIDLSRHDESDRNAQVRLHKIEEAQNRFDLSVGPLIRGRLLRLQPLQHLLLITVHHIVSDGWSMGILIREILELYGAYREGRDDPLPPLPVQYADYAHWQRERLRGPILDKQLSYWRSQLAGAPPEIELRTDRPRPPIQGHRGQSVPVVLDEQLSAELNALARRNEMTLFMVLYAGWAMLLSRLSGQQDVVIGTPIANRRLPELEGLIGFFVNTLPIRTEISGELLLSEFLQHVKEATLGAFDHQDIPFEQVVEALRPQRSLDRHPLFQMMFVLQNAPRSTWSLPGLMVTLDETTNQTSKFDLLLSLEEEREGIRGRLVYDTDLFDRETVERWTACLEVLLRSMPRGEQTRTFDLPILPDCERRKVIELFNATHTSYPQEKLIHEVFEEQVKYTPDAVALVYEGASLTYAELNTRANQLARYLNIQGVEIGDYIPILMWRSPQMLVAQLAVLKCGGVYVPLDPDLPPERRAFMIRDCRAKVILTDAHGLADLATGEARWINGAEVADLIAQQVTTNLQLQLRSTAPAYVMYTSGSTGLPKGVVVPHRAVNRLAINNGYAHITPEDCIPHHSNPAFDASTFEIWGALLNGARVVLVPQALVLDAARFGKLMKEQRATILWMSVGLFNQYSDALAHAFAGLRYLLVGGDRLEPAAIRRVLCNNPPQRLLNAYGPTECTTFSTTYWIESIDEGASTVPIGRPMANAQIYILDARGQPVPIGVAGEMHIGGAGVACGYLNRSELTSERFLPDPFSNDPLARVYKTGDLARWRFDGAIEFLGRNDFQLKVRGFRVELGEIEAQLVRHERVREAVVVAREDHAREKQLVAYVVLRGPTDTPTASSEAQIREYLKSTLPEYMVPATVVIIERIPLTSNGKVDRQALPPPAHAADEGRQYEPPQGEVEEELARIWQDVLQLERVGRHDNFFELGGHSLLAVKVLFRVNQSLGSALQVTDIYKSATIKELGARIVKGVAEDEIVDLWREAALDSQIVATRTLPSISTDAILLTGGTGFVGRFLLAQLLQDTDATIYCLVRSPAPEQAMSRISTTLAKWNLCRNEFQHRIVPIAGDLRLPRLGLDVRTYDMVCRTVDSIYHCATSMNHLETYRMAKPANVESARELLKMATNGKSKLLNHVSTLSVFSASADGTGRIVSEVTPIDTEQHRTSCGYAASKWVSEKIFMTASERGIPCNIFRLGLAWADTQQGRYDELQREYRILKSCLLAGCGIQKYRYEMGIIPVDCAARAIVSLATLHPGGQGTFHVTSSSQVQDVFERCNESANTCLRLLPLYDWICEIKRLHYRGQSLPVVPLVEYAFSMDERSFYEQQSRTRAARVRFDSARTCRELERMGVCAPELSDDLLRICVERMFSTDVELRGLSQK